MALNLNYNSLTLGIINYLKANSNTLNTSLTTAVQHIDEFDPSETPLNNAQYPAISVDVKSHSEEPDDINHLTKQITCTWEIGVHIRDLNGPKTARQTMRTLVGNVQYALRSDVSLSNTFHEAYITGAEFGTVINEQGVYQQNGTISFETINYVR